MEYLDENKTYSKEANAILKRFTDRLYKTANDNPKMATLDDFKSQKEADSLTNEELEDIYIEYQDYYDALKDSLKDIPKLPKPKNYDDDFGWLLHNYITNHAAERRVLSKKDFKKLTRYWKNGRKERTMDEWYELYYKNLHEALPGLTYTYNTDSDKDISHMVYKSPNKRKVLYKYDFPSTGDKEMDADNDYLLDKLLEEDLKNKEYIPRSFPLKFNKRYYLHKVSSPNTYMIDIMFTGKFAYLVAINVNTRYLFVKMLNKSLDKLGNANSISTVSTLSNRSSKRFVSTLNGLRKQGMIPETLIGDDEGCFNSDYTQKYYDYHNIEFVKIPRMLKGVYPKFMDVEQNTGTQPLHSSLGIIDRVIRTIRDMAYNAELGIITPPEMKQLVELYNNAPHKSLSHYAGEEVSPIMVQNDPELEKFIARRIQQENYNIKQKPGYQLDMGSFVKVYNETDKFNKRRSIIQPGSYIITDFYNNLYTVEKVDENGNIDNDSYDSVQRLPRYRITLENDKVNSRI